MPCLFDQALGFCSEQEEELEQVWQDWDGPGHKWEVG